MHLIGSGEIAEENNRRKAGHPLFFWPFTFANQLIAGVGHLSGGGGRGCGDAPPPPLRMK